MKMLPVPIGLCRLQETICCAQMAEIGVDLNHAGKKVSPDQFGKFFEKINDAGEGENHTELVRNRSLKEAPTLDVWSEVHAASAQVKIFFETGKSLNAVRPHSLRVGVPPPNCDRTSLPKVGYRGVAVQKGTADKFAMHGRAVAGLDDPVTVSANATNFNAELVITPNLTSPTGLPLSVLHCIRANVRDIPIVWGAFNANANAYGMAHSNWGALRAKASYPAPCALKYVQTGNEEGEKSLYPERHKLMEATVKTKFPARLVLANDRNGSCNHGLPMGLIDEPIFTPSIGAVALGKQLDDPHCKRLITLVAEYVPGKVSDQGKMCEMLAEAILHGAIERNFEVTDVASDTKVHVLNWWPEKIYFNKARPYATLSYVVQKMMVSSRPDHIVFIKVKVGDLKIKMDGRSAGDEVTGTTTNHTHIARVRQPSGDGGIVARLAPQDYGGTYPAFYLGFEDCGNTERWGGFGSLNVRVCKPKKSFSGPISPEVNGTLATGRWCNITIRFTGRSVVCFLNGKEIRHAAMPETRGPLNGSATGRRSTGSVVTRYANISPIKRERSIAVVGTGTNEGSTVGSTLTSADFVAKNSLSAPTRSAPAEHKLSFVARNSKLEMEGNWFTVYTLPRREDDTAN